MKNKSVKKLSVVGINSSVDAYHSALEFYRKYPTMPTYCRLLKKALAANLKLDLIESELRLLHGISVEQFFCPRGCNYLRANALWASDDITWPDSLSNMEVSKNLWDIFQSFKTRELYGFENYLLGDSDYYYLTKSDDDIKKETSVNPISTGEVGKSPLAQMAYEMGVAFADMEKSSRAIQAEAEKLGLKMIPWSALAADILENRKNLKAGLEDFSDYLSSYFADVGSQRESNDESGTERMLDAENAKSLLRISSFLLFYSLLSRDDKKNIAISYDDFFIERLVNYSSIDVFLNINERSEYIISISNLLMMCAKFGMSSVESELVTVDELKRKYLDSCTSEYLDTACLALLPPSGFSQMVPMINPFEGDREDDYSLNDVLRVCDYGVTGSPNKRHVDKLYESGFMGMDDGLVKALRSKSEMNLRKWTIPLVHVDTLSRIYKEFWQDEGILRKISESLSYADKEAGVSCRFSIDDISDMVFHPDMYEDDHHPAMFARRFSNKVDFLRMEDEEWLSFAKALNNGGQKRFFCILVSLFFIKIGYQKYFNWKDAKIDIPEWVKLLQTARSLNSFEIVEQSLLDMFELCGDPPILFKGSLAEFVTASKYEASSFRSKEGDRYQRYRKDLIASGLLIDNLNVDSQESLVKGYTLTRDKDLAVYNLNVAAIQNYFIAVEGELRSRMTSLDERVAEELMHFNIELDFITEFKSNVRIAKIRGLYGILLLIQNFTRLSESSRRKLIKIAPLAVHKNCSEFLLSLGEFRRIRNSVMHPDRPSSGGRNTDDLVRIVEDLLFGSGKIISVLCDTKK
jgi:hypothetical protein